MAAGPAQAEDADRQRLLRPHPVRARRVRLLGVRRRLAAGAAAVVELSQGGRRRHHRRHAVPLALRARQSVRQREERDLPRRHAHPAALGRERQAATTRRPTTPRTRRSSSTAPTGRSSRRSTARGARACAATTSRRSTSTARSAPRSPVSPTAGSQPRATTPKPVWNPDVPQTIDFYDTWQKVPGQPRLRQRVQGRVGAVPAPRRRRRHRSAGTCSRAPRACSSPSSGLQSWARAPRGRRAGARRLTSTMPTLSLPRADGTLADVHAARRRDVDAARGARPRGIASRSRPRTSSPIRARAIDPWLDAAIDWDATLAYRRHLWSLGLRRRRSDGHRAARHGPRLADVARADPPQRSPRRATTPGAVVVLRRRHRPSRAATRRRRIDDVIAAYEEQCEAIEARRRPHHPDGEPRARRVRALARRLRARLRPRAGAGARSR